MMTILLSFLLLMDITSAFPLENRGSTRPVAAAPLEDPPCPKLYQLTIPKNGTYPIEYMGHGAHGCTYTLELIDDKGGFVPAVAKVSQEIWPVDREIAGLKAVRQWITDFEEQETGRFWVIMHLQPGVPLWKTNGWLISVRSDGRYGSRESHLPKEVCVEYLEMAYEAHTTEVTRIAETYKVHNLDRHLGNVSYDSSTVDLSPRTIPTRNNVIEVLFQEHWGGNSLSMTARIIDWGRWDETPPDETPNEVALFDTDVLKLRHPIKRLCGP